MATVRSVGLKLRGATSSLYLEEALVTTVQPYNPLVGSIQGFHDGDTAYIDILLPQLERFVIVQSRPVGGSTLRVRFARIQAPELPTPAGKQSLAELAMKVGSLPATVYLYSTTPTHYVSDNYGGRIDAEVMLASDGTNLSDWMLTNGWAKIYGSK
jgi:endonuclease YncB( thermonuclease family)